MITGTELAFHESPLPDSCAGAVVGEGEAVDDVGEDRACECVAAASTEEMNVERTIAGGTLTEVGVTGEAVCWIRIGIGIWLVVVDCG